MIESLKTMFFNLMSRSMLDVFNFIETPFIRQVLILMEPFCLTYPLDIRNLYAIHYDKPCVCEHLQLHGWVQI